MFGSISENNINPAADNKSSAVFAKRIVNFASNTSNKHISINAQLNLIEGAL